MGFDKPYYKKGGYPKKVTPPAYKPKRGKLAPLMKEEDKQKAGIHELSYDFGCRMVRLYQYLTDPVQGSGFKVNDDNEDYHEREYIMSKQLYRSGTSVGANVRESKHAQSDNDFLSKDGKDGPDVWLVQMLEVQRAKVIRREYEVARVYIPGEGMSNTNRPKTIIEGNPVMPSFARFYFENKFLFNLSENRIIKMLEMMQTKIPQSTLNNWMHQLMELLRERLQFLMLESIKRSIFTNNDETRILVRSRATKDAPFKYNIEYIHAVLSLEQKLVVMLYKEGSRNHTIQEEALFRESDIKYFLADRAPLYQTIEKDLEEYHIVRVACWFHARHYMVDAYITDSRVYDIIEYINLLFYVEKESAARGHTPLQRLRFRLKYSQLIVRKIMRRLEEIRLAGNEYGELVQKAVDYILDDKESFLKFLQDGRIDLSNNAIERCFRNIAIGRRNWLHTGSHFAAENIAFMYSLLESCKLNDLNFGEYVEDILTRFMDGEVADESFLPNHYVARQKKGQKVA